MTHPFDLRRLQQHWTERLATLDVIDRGSRSLPDDLTIHETGAVYTTDSTLDYLWFELSEIHDGVAQRTFKVVRLAMLTYLPSQEREQSTLLIEMPKALKSVSTAQLDLIYVSANIRQSRCWRS
jgi:hypothetical protein